MHSARVPFSFYSITCYHSLFFFIANHSLPIIEMKKQERQSFGRKSFLWRKTILFTLRAWEWIFLTVWGKKWKITYHKGGNNKNDSPKIPFVCLSDFWFFSNLLITTYINPYWMWYLFGSVAEIGTDQKKSTTKSLGTWVVTVWIVEASNPSTKETKQK